MPVPALPETAILQVCSPSPSPLQLQHDDFVMFMRSPRVCGRGMRWWVTGFATTG